MFLPRVPEAVCFCFMDMGLKNIVNILIFCDTRWQLLFFAKDLPLFKKTDGKENVFLFLIQKGTHTAVQKNDSSLSSSNQTFFPLLFSFLQKKYCFFLLLKKFHAKIFL